MFQRCYSERSGEFETAAAAKAARDAEYRRLVKAGYRVKRFVLRNQVIKYSGLGQPDGRIIDVYGFNAYGPELAR